MDARGSWIHAPRSIVVSTSIDGTNFKEVQAMNYDAILNSKGNISLKFPKQKVRFVKIIVQNIGEIPEGYPGTGYDAWLFVDELSIQ